jgi:hypothetical protein
LQVGVTVWPDVAWTLFAVRLLIATLAAVIASVALAAGSLGAVPPALVAGSPGVAPPACPPAGGHTLLESAGARMYTTRDGGLGVCTIAEGRWAVLAFAETFYRPPVMALAGTMAAMVVNDPNDDYPFIQAIDLGPSGFRRVFNRPHERIGSLRVRPDGTLAFIACPPGHYDSADPPITPGPTCRHAGHWRDTVYLAARGRGVRRVAHGRRLAPASLQLSDTTISWRQDGRRRRMAYR